MSYCDFNPRLFKQFTSKHKKITPAMADDWEIIPEKFRSSGGFSLKSEKLNQEVADIDLRRFLEFCKEQNLTIEGLKLKGTFVIGNDRSVYTTEMFNEWKAKYDVRTEIIIDKKDYKVGHLYLTPCGAELIYLGVRYMSKIKDSGETYFDISKITKKHLVLPKGTESDSYGYYLKPLNQKFSKDLGKSKSEEEVDAILDSYYNTSMFLTYFSKENCKNPVYEFQECKPYKYAIDYGMAPRTEQYSLLIEDSKKQLWGKRGDVISENGIATRVNPVDDNFIKPISWRGKEVKVSKYIRVGIKNGREK